MNEGLRVAIISDLHCRVRKEGESAVTRLYSDLPRRPEMKHPVSALLKLIKSENLTADILLCPGDIADKADNQGLISGWEFLKELQRAFGAKHLLATVGNHDVKSRSKTEPAFEFLKNFDELYPLGDEEANKDLWKNNFTVLRYDYASVLVYNSCYSHTDSEKAESCNITPAALEAIDSQITGLDNQSFKIALCHHHPMKHSNKDYADNDVMDKGDDLLNLLETQSFNLVIHGHKHDPRLTMHGDLPVLASGSFSSRENLLESGAENVFHMVHLSKAPNRGNIQTYLYKPSNGWNTNYGGGFPKYTARFPSYTGFGAYKSIDILANECSEWFQEKPDKYIDYKELLSQFPSIDFLNTIEQKKFQTILFDTHKMQFLPALEDRPKFLYKMI